MNFQRIPRSAVLEVNPIEGSRRLLWSEGDTVAALVRHGSYEGAEVGDLLIWEREGGELFLSPSVDLELLLLAGVPIAEPVVGHGPFSDLHYGLCARWP